MEECITCGRKALYTCKPCNALFCEEHKTIHEMNTKRLHIFEVLKLRLDSSQTARIVENLTLKINKVKEFQERIVQETTALIQKIGELCKNSLTNAKAMLKYYKHLLQITQNALEPEEFNILEKQLDTTLSFNISALNLKEVQEFYNCELLEKSICYNQRTLTQCAYCGVPTTPKENIGGACCLNCIVQGRHTYGTNDILLAYKAIAKISNEYYQQLNGVCSICRSIPDVFLIGNHWCCYNCIFTHMNFEDCIRCPSGCCYAKKEKLPSIASSIAYYPTTYLSSNNELPYSTQLRQININRDPDLNLAKTGIYNPFQNETRTLPFSNTSTQMSVDMSTFEEEKQLLSGKTNPLIKTTTYNNKRPIPSHLTTIHIMT